MKVFYIIILLGISFFLYSCTASKNEITNVEDISVEDLVSRVNLNSEKLSTLDAEGEVSIDSPEFSNTGSITVSVKKPDSVYTKIEGPFGITVAQILITRNNFIYYNVMDNKVIKGPSSSLNLGAIVRINLDFDDIVNGFSGTYTFKDINFSQSNVTIDKNDYLLTVIENAEVKKYWIHPKYFYIKKYGTYSLSNELKFIVEYSDFNYKERVYFPGKIYINRPKERQNIWLTYYTTLFNNGRLTYKLRYPPSATVTIWD